MSGAAFTVETRDLAEIDRRFAALAAHTGDASPLMLQIAASLEASTLQRFEDEAAPDGTPWKPSIRALAEGGQTLTDTARLRGSVSSRSGRETAEIGSNVIYAGIHQRGGRAGRGKSVTLPARAYLGLSAGDEAELGNLVGEYLAGDFR